MDMGYSEKKKILILSASFGDGHNQVAKAICEAAEFSLPEVEPIILDIMEWVHPHLYPITNYLYKRGIKRFPTVYSYFYKRTRETNSFSITLNSILSAGMRSVLQYINTIKPAVVVSTYPFAAGIMSKLKEQGLIHVPIVTVITDYTDHSYWIHPNTDQYIVGSSQVLEKLISVGVETTKIKCTGIPIRQRFTHDYSRKKLAAKLGLDPGKFTLLVMGGGEGLIGKGISTFYALDSIQVPLQIIIICGRNDKLLRQLDEVAQQSKHDIVLRGFCEDVNELMAVSDVMITKPGGVTAAEAIAMELPLMIYDPLPGQEEDNANYLLEAGLALHAENESDLILKIQLLLRESFVLSRMKENIRKCQTNTSAFEALNAIIRTYSHQDSNDFIAFWPNKFRGELKNSDPESHPYLVEKNIKYEV
ncbi:MAG: glycosyltransferase [Bacillota bacterium]|nr:glycosyltransferase [Bacillota bacterium]